MGEGEWFKGEFITAFRLRFLEFEDGLTHGQYV